MRPPLRRRNRMSARELNAREASGQLGVPLPVYVALLDAGVLASRMVGDERMASQADIDDLRVRIERGDLASLLGRRDGRSEDRVRLPAELEETVRDLVAEMQRPGMNDAALRAFRARPRVRLGSREAAGGRHRPDGAELTDERS
jgi:hypothetical protein